MRSRKGEYSGEGVNEGIKILKEGKKKRGKKKKDERKKGKIGKNKQELKPLTKFKYFCNLGGG